MKKKEDILEYIDDVAQSSLTDQDAVAIAKRWVGLQKAAYIRQKREYWENMSEPNRRSLLSVAYGVNKDKPWEGDDIGYSTLFERANNLRWRLAGKEQTDKVIRQMDAMELVVQTARHVFTVLNPGQKAMYNDVETSLS